MTLSEHEIIDQKLNYIILFLHANSGNTHWERDAKKAIKGLETPSWANTYTEEPSL